jgi:mono/diheme cytochrome c family protein
MKQILVAIAIVLIAIVVLGAATIGTGAYDVAADAEHTEPVYWLLQTIRERSIAVRASSIHAPNLEDPERLRRAAGNYDSMCAGCHLAPQAQATELSRGLYPRPPNLARAGELDPARAFWIIKHGIKSTGMPAWGQSMEDAYIWDLVAFIQALPRMSTNDYAAAVRTSEGHSHGGGESADQHHHGEHADQHDHTREPGHEHSHD